MCSVLAETEHTFKWTNFWYKHWDFGIKSISIQCSFQNETLVDHLGKTIGAILKIRGHNMKDGRFRKKETVTYTFYLCSQMHCSNCVQCIIYKNQVFFCVIAQPTKLLQPTFLKHFFLIFSLIFCVSYILIFYSIFHFQSIDLPVI